MAPDVRADFLVAEDNVRERSDNPQDRVPGKLKPDVAVWLGFLASPAAALTHLQLSYVFDHTSCSTRSTVLIHAVSAVLLAIVVIAGIVSHREWVKVGSGDPGQLPGPVGSRRFLSLAGMLGAFIFGLFILAQWFPNLLLGPCIRT